MDTLGGGDEEDTSWRSVFQLHITPEGFALLLRKAFRESLLIQAGVNVKNEEFAAAIIVLIEDEAALRRASHRDLAVIEGVLTVILDSVTAELQQREQHRGRSP